MHDAHRIAENRWRTMREGLDGEFHANGAARQRALAATIGSTGLAEWLSDETEMSAFSVAAAAALITVTPDESSSPPICGVRTA